MTAHANRFEPVLVSGDDLDDLATFTGLSREECRERLESYSLAEHAEAWCRTDPQGEAAVHDFYRQTELYIWELMQWHASEDRSAHRTALRQFAADHPPSSGYSRVLDFGSGVGSDALFLAERGYNVTLVDVPGHTFDFAKHRFLRRGINATFIESTSDLPEVAGPFDAAVCFDVFEHLLDPLEAARRIVALLRPGGALLEQSTFGAEAVHPCHLPAGVHRFGGGRWRVHLAGLGLRSEGFLTYRKPARMRELRIQRLRFALWRATGLWVTYLRRA